MARKDPDVDHHELVERLQSVNARAIDLTEALLVLSRADQRSFTREDVDLSLLAEESAETLLSMAEQRGVTIETSAATALDRRVADAPAADDDEPRAQRDRPQPRRDGGAVWVTTSARPDSAVLTVENTGGHLSPALVDTLVEPFQRGGRARRAPTTQASGLGLAIVDSIVRAHDGILTLTPRPDGGLRVTVQLPRARGS